MARDRELEEREKKVLEELERLKRILKALNIRAKRVFGEGR
jgi:hypothetical protein